MVGRAPNATGDGQIAIASGQRYTIIYADPPWSYRDKAHAGKRGAFYKYELMDIEDIKALPVDDLAAANSALFLWVTPPLLVGCLEVIDSWGFTYKTIAFTWVKTNPASGTFFMGMGNYTRANAELCLLALKGKLSPVSRAVRSLVAAPRGKEHSKKPDEVRRRIVQLFGDVRRIELFARHRSVGWHAWGNEMRDSDVELADGRDPRRSGRHGRVWIPRSQFGPGSADPP